MHALFALAPPSASPFGPPPRVAGLSEVPSGTEATPDAVFIGAAVAGVTIGGIFLLHLAFGALDAYAARHRHAGELLARG
jgi:hypothetical protein